jgi:catechol 2,3-dioxygenase-like lactoylglutathione lyase family enzyme
MSNSAIPFGLDRLPVRLDNQDPYVSLHFIMVFVRDQEKSLRFYVDQLGFRLVVDVIVPSGGRWIEVAPPDGSTSVALVGPTPGTDAYNFIGRDTNIYFITEDIHAKYKQWSERGVRFLFPPQTPSWGGIFTRFEDLDGNSFGLAGFDELTRGIEAQRAILARRLESDAARCLSWKLPEAFNRGCFPRFILN